MKADIGKTRLKINVSFAAAVTLTLILDESGVSSAGFSTTVFPHASAGPSFQLAMFSGKFHGTISPTTPYTRTVMPRATTTRIAARARNDSSATSLSAITMISAERMKSVRIAPETISSSRASALAGVVPSSLCGP